MDILSYAEREGFGVLTAKRRKLFFKGKRRIKLFYGESDKKKSLSEFEKFCGFVGKNNFGRRNLGIFEFKWI